MDQQWSWKDLTVIVPVTASSFAFAYVVGYFYAFDIGWFAFFSLPEHLIFALRALPIAVGASVGFLIALRFRTLEDRWKWLQGRLNWLVLGWIGVLAIAAVLALAGSHPSLSLSFALIAAGSYIYNLSGPSSPFASVLFWAITLMVLCLMVGFVSGSSWRFHGYFPLDRPMLIASTKSGGASNSSQGHVIFAGNSWVLFYDYEAKKVRLLRPANIDEISECGYLDCAAK
jgi:hypothetical protein